MAVSATAEEQSVAHDSATQKRPFSSICKFPGKISAGPPFSNVSGTKTSREVKTFNLEKYPCSLP
jgi:hypothetical protein